MRTYPHLEGNPNLHSRMKRKMKPYLLPITHPLMSKLDRIFSSSRVTLNQQSVIDAGFTIISSMTHSFVIVAKHPDLPGYVCKMHLDTEKKQRHGKSCWEWLVARCKTATKIQKIIRKKKIKHFVVPDKYLYILPPYPKSKSKRAQHLILVQTDMQLATEKESEAAWKKVITETHLKELYAILKKGYGSSKLSENIPYTKKGTFAFIDTERPHSEKKMYKVLRYIPKEQHRYWNKLIK